MFRSVILGVISLLLVACSATAPATNTSQTTGVPDASGAYPAADQAYPAATNTSGYTAPEQGPEFAFNEPVRASDAQVSGTGPAGVPVKIVDVTNGGTTLSEVVIGADGTFSANVEGQLTSGNRIAIQLGSTAGTQVDPNDFRYGPGYQDLPPIGLVFDMAMVE